MLDGSAECVLVERNRSVTITHPEFRLDVGARFGHAGSMRPPLLGRCLPRTTAAAREGPPASGLNSCFGREAVVLLAWNAAVYDVILRADVGGERRDHRQSAAVLR